MLTAALAWTLHDATTSLPHHVCTSAVSGAGVRYHPILCHDSTSIQGRISIVCKAGISLARPAGWWSLLFESRRRAASASAHSSVPRFARSCSAFQSLEPPSHIQPCQAQLHDLQNFEFIQEKCFEILFAYF